MTNPEALDRLLVNGSSAASGTLASGIAWTRTDTSVSLSGTATKDQYAAALRLIQFENTGDNPGATVRLITITVSDGTNTSNTAVATINVTPVNDAPVGVNDTSVAVEAGGVANGTAGSNATGTVLTNDTDVDSGATLTVTAVRTGSVEGSGTAGTLGSALTGTYGTLTLNANGSYTYVVDNTNATVQALAAGQTLTESFNYTVSDGSLTDIAVLTITVTGTNDAPVATDDATSTSENTVLNSSVPAATDMDGTIASYTLVADVTEGSLTFNTDGTYSFDPGSDFDDLAVGATRDVTFTYTATDNTGAVSGTQTVTITVTGTNDAPVATDDATSTSENTVLNSSVPAATDVDGTIASYTLVADVTEGSLTFNTDGTYSFDPGSDFDDLAVGATRDVTFTYTATDNTGAVSGTQTVTITVTGTNDAPVATDDATSTSENTVLNSSVPAATDVDGTIASYTLVADVTEGGLTFNTDGTYSFDPGSDFDDLAVGATRDVTFTYTATDNTGAVSGTQTVTITVTGTNDAPVATKPCLRSPWRRRSPMKSSLLPKQQNSWLTASSLILSDPLAISVARGSKLASRASLSIRSTTLSSWSVLVTRRTARRHISCRLTKFARSRRWQLRLAMHFQLRAVSGMCNR